MAGLGAKLFTDGSVLNAAQVNGYLMDQSIMRFATTAARDAAFGGVGEPTLAEGMCAYIDDLNVLQIYSGSNWVLITDAIVADITARTALSGQVNGSKCYVQSINEPQVFNGSVWVTMLPLTAIDVTLNSIPVSGAYTNFTASVSLYTGTSADVTLISQGLSNSSGSTTLVSFAVSGATTIAGSDANSISHIGANIVGKSRIIRVTGLTAGLNTFTIAARTSGVGGLVDRPSITVQAII
jgi:hypothetical protein